MPQPGLERSCFATPCIRHVMPPAHLYRPRAVGGQQGPSADKSSSKPSQADMQARLAKAREYKRGGQPAPSASPPAPLVRPDTSTTQSSQQGASLETDLLIEPQLTAQKPESVSAFVISERTDGSGASSPETTVPKPAVPNPHQAAKFLGGVTAEGTKHWLTDEERKLSPERQTMLITERKRQNQKVEIITVDQTYQPGLEGDASYKPKVATWGVFPRPDNISKTFGGGRTIRPGEDLESEERKAARRAKTAAILQKYKESLELEMTPEAEATARMLYESGSELMRKGKLEIASERFREAVSFANFNSQLGGDCRIQLAICLDSTSRTEEAASLYKQLTRHPQAYISKRAKQMIFGLKSMDYLKTHTISYSADAAAFQPYFTKLSGDYNVGYKAPDNASSSNTFIVIIIAVLFAAPLAFIAGRIMLR